MDMELPANVQIIIWTSVLYMMCFKVTSTCIHEQIQESTISTEHLKYISNVKTSDSSAHVHHRRSVGVQLYQPLRIKVFNVNVDGQITPEDLNKLNLAVERATALISNILSGNYILNCLQFK